MDIYEYAEKWVTQCLRDKKSLLFNDKEIWTEENLKEFLKTFINNYEHGGGDFFEKLKNQFKEANTETWLLICELLSLHYMFSSKIKKIEIHLEKIIDNISDSSFDRVAAEKIIKKLNNIQGKVYCAQNYYGDQWRGIIYYAWIALAYKQNKFSINEIIDSLIESKEPEWLKVEINLRGKAFNFDNDDMGIDFDKNQNKKFQEEETKKRLPHVSAILHMLCPEYYGQIISKGDIEKIIETFGYLLDDENKNSHQDKKFYEINTAISDEYNVKYEPRKKLIFYDNREILSRWYDKPTKAKEKTRCRNKQKYC